MFKRRSSILRAQPSPRWAKAVGVFVKSHAVLATTGMATTVMALLVGCGQPGPLYLPTDPAAAKRATLPEVLNPMRKPAQTTSSPAPSTVTAPTPTPDQK